MKHILVLSAETDHVLVVDEHIVAVQEVSEKDVRGGKVMSKTTTGSRLLLTTGGVLEVDEAPDVVVRLMAEAASSDAVLPEDFQ